MPVSPSNLTTGTAGAGTSASTASITPAANALILVTVSTRTAITLNPTTPTLSGNSLTYVQIGTVVYDDSSSSRRRLTLFRALGASPTAGAITIDEALQVNTVFEWVVDQITNPNISGTNGSGAIVQSKTNFDDSATATSLTVTFDAPPTSGFVYGAFANGNGTDTSTSGSGFTKSGDVTDSSDIRTTTEYQAGNDQTVDMSWNNASEIGGIAVEILSAAASTNTLAALGVG